MLNISDLIAHQITIFITNTETNLPSSKKKRKQCTTKPY